MCRYRDEMEKITSVLLEPEDNYGEIRETVIRMYDLFLEASELGECEDISKEDIYLPYGKAIGPFWAAACIKELMRTKNFIRGIYNGIIAAQKKFPGETIHIVYAGTGPFAALAMPMTTVFTPREINFTFLEINPESVSILKNTIEALGAGEYVREIVMCDAVKYKYEGGGTIHMVITETMQNALQKEPHVAITMNLLPQMHSEGVFIPQTVKIEAVLLNQKKNIDRMTSMDVYTDKYYHSVGTVLEISKASCENYMCDNVPEGQGYVFPEVVLDIPPDLEEGYNELNLFTFIRIFEEITLESWQCSLTMPRKVMLIDNLEARVDRVAFQYIVDSSPHFEYKPFLTEAV
ncbi:hypothetical protein DFR58_14615 [Anaerobacterium chartisolvens]|uniref:PRMT5 arginine-N-methyltransferase domain-containing protein n=1 Tax=Anaerobacterium chartisolvens TaxID=1297424 RepID=A0A369AFG5_9FIRM|nr:phytanoyl-CoA dioxygenase [Anaerobacterium chartisolvens]RCX08090.1 hypothetical protein DFR58_14615 [Anaerobacterium chartisolvens]